MSRHWTAEPRAHLAAIVAAYAALAFAIQAHAVDLLSSDGECYLRMAGWYAAGDLRHAVFGHWSPLPAWVTAPLVAAGVTPRVAMRLWIGAWGALCVVGVWRLAGRFELGAWLRAAAAGCAALLIAEFSIVHRVDLLVTALLLLYLDAVMDPRLLASRWRAAAVGLLGGLAYLAKQYALPFVLVHVALVVLLHGWRRRGEAIAQEEDTPERVQAWHPLWGMVRTWGMAVGAFAVVAAPWVGVLSGKYGRLTIGTAGASTYQQYGPDHAGGRRPPTGLRRPPADAPNVWHDATLDATGPRPDIPSPLASREALVRQLRLMGRNLGIIAGHLAATDELRLAVAALALAPVAFVLTRRRREVAFRYAAAALTVAVYCGGYALLFADVQRYYWFPMLVLLVLAFHLVGRVPAVLGRRLSERRRRLLAAALGVVAVVSFAFHPVRAIGILRRSPPPGRQHRLVAARLAELGVRGPLACMGGDAWWNGLHVAYYLDAQYAGTPRATAPAGIASEMREAGARTLLVWGGSGLPLLSESAFALAGRVTAAEVPGLEAEVAVVRLRDDAATER